MLGPGFDDNGGGPNESVEMGAALQSDGARAEELAADVAGDAGTSGGDGQEEFDPGPALDAQVLATDATHDFPVSADDQIPRAIDGAGEFTQHSEMMTLDDTTGNHPAFENDDVPACLNAAVPRAVNLIVEEAHITTTARTLAGLGLCGGSVMVAAIKA